ncbi:hypothetical protein [Lactococcus lactis]
MGEHFYTTSPFDRDNLEKGGWKSERVEVWQYSFL